MMKLKPTAIKSLDRWNALEGSETGLAHIYKEVNNDQAKGGAVLEAPTIAESGDATLPLWRC